MNKWISYKKRVLREIIVIAVRFKVLVSLDTLKSACQKSQTKLFVISGKDENVEKYQNVQLSRET